MLIKFQAAEGHDFQQNQTWQHLVCKEELQPPQAAYAVREPVTPACKMLMDDPKTHSCKMGANYQLPCLHFPDCFTHLKSSHLARVIEWGVAKPMKALHHPACQHPTQPSPSPAQSQPCPALTQPQPQSQPCSRAGLAPAPPNQATDCLWGGTWRVLLPGVLVRTCHSLGLSGRHCGALSLEAMWGQLIATAAA